MGEVGGPRVYMVRAYINHVTSGLIVFSDYDTTS